jgi:FMN phosphatase YigB (HAD superfamily)
MINTIIFDFGGVLVDWNPRYLFRNYFGDDQKMEWFLGNICTDDWNIEQDRGRLIAEASRRFGIQTIHFQSPEQLRNELVQLNIL